MLSKRYKYTEVERRTWLHVPSGTHWFTISDAHQVVDIQIRGVARRAFVRKNVHIVFAKKERNQKKK